MERGLDHALGGLTVTVGEDRVDLSTPRGRSEAVRGAILRLAGVLRLSRLHTTENRALRLAVEELRGRLEPVLAALGQLTLEVDGGVMRANGAVVADLQRPNTPNELLLVRDDLKFHGVGSIELLPPCSPRELLMFLAVWRRRNLGLKGDGLQLKLAELGVQTIVVYPPRDNSERSVGADSTGGLAPRDVLDGYASLLAVSELIADPDLPIGKSMLLKVQAAVDRLASFTDSAPDLVLFASTHRDVANYPVVHPANTATLAMLLGRRLGLTHEAVAELGRAALLCDIGMRSLPRELRLDPNELDGPMTQLLLDHPLLSLLAGLDEGRLEPANRAQLVVAWEHHAGLDGQGYPHAAPEGRPHLFARIVSICDAYDALVHDRGDRSGLARPLALEALFQEVDRRFDRQLLYAFFGMMGRFPPGSVVRLRDGAIAIVGTPADDPRLFDRPELFVVRDRTGETLPRPTRLDLGTQRGERATRIMDTLDDRLFEESLFQLVF